MNSSQITARRKTVNAALGSVRAEGLKPSAQTQKQLQNYADGKITAEQLRKATLRSIPGTARIVKK